MLATIPPANQTSAVTNEITIVVGARSESRPMPDVKGQTVEDRRQADPHRVRVHSTSVPVRGRQHISRCGQVVGTLPLAGRDSSGSTPRSRCRCRRCNQFVMPDVRGGFWTDVEPNLRNAYGWTGQLVRAPDVQNSGQRTNAVVTQSPAPGTHSQVRRPDHAGVRVVAACTALATSSSSRRTSDSAGAAPQ